MVCGRRTEDTARLEWLILSMLSSPNQAESLHLSQASDAKFQFIIFHHRMEFVSNPEENEGPTVLAATLTVTSVALVVVAARLWVRLGMIHSFGFDVSLQSLGLRDISSYRKLAAALIY